ncbi:MAG: DUF4858 domain-containing protein [Tannerellaceae bacterium]|nr:DUF4858 domain-containing protein [Tannerellaceae bacterium]
MSLSAQWTEKDSVWLKEVLSGEKELKLIPEIEKAIRSGTLLETGKMQPKLLSAPPVLPISKDFSSVIKPDTIDSPMDILNLPPAVVIRYLQAIQEDKLKIDSGAYTPAKSLEEEYYKIPGAPAYIKGSIEDLFLDEVKDGQKRGSFNGRIKYKFSLEDTLRYVFWKSERDKKEIVKRHKPGNTIIQCLNLFHFFYKKTE